MSVFRNPVALGAGLAAGLFAGAAMAQTPTYHRLSNIEWSRRPKAEEMASAYPTEAMDSGRGGAAVVECLVTPRGGTTDCVVLADSEPHFGKASLQIARKFAFDVRKVSPDMLEGGVVTIPISFGGDKIMRAVALDYVAGRRAFLMTPAKGAGNVPCATKTAPDQRCDLHELTWERQPELEETAAAVRSVTDGPSVTGLLCSLRVDRQLDECRPMGAHTEGQLNAMDQLVSMFTAGTEADDKTPITEGSVLMRFNWPVLRRTIEASRLSPPAKPQN